MTYSAPEKLDFVSSVHFEYIGSWFRIGTTSKIWALFVGIGKWIGDVPNGIDVITRAESLAIIKSFHDYAMGGHGSSE